MKKPELILNASLFASGVKMTAEDNGKLEFKVSSKTKDVLVVETEMGYEVIHLRPDVKRIYLEVTTECNFSCITCIRATWDDALCHMSMGTFNHILKSLENLPNLESVHFGGFGEPMMHPNIFEMISAIKAMGLKVEMITNGSYLSDENIQKIIDLKLDILYTSIDSPDETNYNEIRLGADFQNVTQNIRKLQEMKASQKVKKPELGIEFVAMQNNFDKLPDLIKLAKDLKASNIVVSNLLPYHESMVKETVYDIEDSGVLFGKASLKTTIFAQVSNMRLRTERLCKFVEDKTLCINHMGQVSPCYALMHSYKTYIYGEEKQMHPCYLGNVNTKALPEIWMDPGYVNFRRVVERFQFPSCTDCKSKDGCTYTESNAMDCWGNSPSCGDCLWARRIIACP